VSAPATRRPSAAEREEVYSGLATLLAAGVPLEQAAASLATRRPRGMADALLPTLRDGLPLHEALSHRPFLAAAHERALVAAGEASGRLEECLRRLAAEASRERALRHRLATSLAYPLFLLGAGVFLLNFPRLFIGGFGSFLGGLCRTLLPLGALVFAGSALHRKCRDKPAWWAVLMRVPLLATLLRNLALARGTRAAATLYDAGVAVDRAFAAAADAAGPGPAGRAFAAAADSMARGSGVHESLARATALPLDLLVSVEVGERSGRLGESLAALAARYEESADEGLRIAARAVPFAIYLLIVAALAWQVLSFWSGYYGRIRSLM
jgi:type II secretory pathway component PulF